MRRKSLSTLRAISEMRRKSLSTSPSLLTQKKRSRLSHSWRKSHGQRKLVLVEGIEAKVRLENKLTSCRQSKFARTMDHKQTRRRRRGEMSQEVSLKQVHRLKRRKIMAKRVARKARKEETSRCGPSSHKSLCTCDVWSGLPHCASKTPLHLLCLIPIFSVSILSRSPCFSSHHHSHLRQHALRNQRGHR